MGLKDELLRIRKKLTELKYYRVPLCILSVEENKEYFKSVLQSINSDSALPRIEDESNDEKEKNVALIPNTTQGHEIYVYKNGDDFIEMITGTKMTFRYKDGASTKAHLGDTGALFIDINGKRSLATDEEIYLYRASKRPNVIKGILYDQQAKAEANYKEIIDYVLLKQAQQQMRNRK